MRRPPLQLKRVNVALAVVALWLLIFPRGASAQSSDVSYPAPVFSNEIVARIAPRDLGDARLTRHYYTFKGTEGDLTVTVESNDLSGDVDVYIARTLRPLLKVTLFGGTATKATKSVYLRKEETMILRVEARAVGDTEGSYRVLLGGSFAPATPELAREPDLTAPSPETVTRTGTRRVTATGARIEEPPTEVAEATPTPTPEEKTEETAKAEEEPAAKREPPRSRRGRNTRAAASRTRRPATEPAPAATTDRTETTEKETAETPKPDEEKSVETTPPAAKTPPRAATRRGSRASRRGAPAPPPVETADSTETAPTPPPPVVTIHRLVIVTKDGETLERDMSTVRRVTVENNQIVVVLKDGKVIRTPLANVEKMSFEP